MLGGLDAKQLGSELRRQYAKRNRAQVMIDFLETSGIGQQPDGGRGYANRPAYKKREYAPNESYEWREPATPRKAYQKRERPQMSAEDYEEVMIRVPDPDGERYVEGAVDDQREELR